MQKNKLTLTKNVPQPNVKFNTKILLRGFQEIFLYHTSPKDAEEKNNSVSSILTTQITSVISKL